MFSYSPYSFTVALFGYNADAGSRSLMAYMPQDIGLGSKNISTGDLLRYDSANDTLYSYDGERGRQCIEIYQAITSLTDTTTPGQVRFLNSYIHEPYLNTGDVSPSMTRLQRRVFHFVSEATAPEESRTREVYIKMYASYLGNGWDSYYQSTNYGYLPLVHQIVKNNAVTFSPVLWEEVPKGVSCIAQVVLRSNNDFVLALMGGAYNDGDNTAY